MARAGDVRAELRHRIADRPLRGGKDGGDGPHPPHRLRAGRALRDVRSAHFWLALVLLGIGWNFGFIGGTALVTETYRPEEKEKVQALNDFLIFGIVAVASFSSGEALIFGGWNVLNLIVLPVAVLCLLALFWRMVRRPRPA